jgi:hypothetical protein
MRTSKIQLRLPDDLKEAAMRQAEAAGVSMNLFIATTLAARIGAQAEAGRYFSARGSRTTAARARALLMRIGSDETPRDGDEIDAA